MAARVLGNLWGDLRPSPAEGVAGPSMIEAADISMAIQTTQNRFCGIRHARRLALMKEKVYGIRNRL
jgi:hypothetical protein